MRNAHVFVLASLGLIVLAIADEQRSGASGPAEKVSPQQTKLRQLIDESVHWYKLLPSLESTESMKAITIMRWPNNTRESSDGATVVWVAAGRPEAVAAIYPYHGKLFVHEFDSLSRGTIVGKRDDQVVWSPANGVKFRVVPDSPRPAESRAARLRQMKTLAKEFSSTLLGWRTDNSQREQLRLLTRPLYRYKINKPEKLLDGALFAFVSGTDPESMLVIEAFRVDDRYEWQYAFVRRTTGALESRFRDQVVWKADRFPAKKDRLSTHIEFARPLDAGVQSD